MSGTDPAVPVDRHSTLDAALARLRLDGAIFLRAEYTEAWAYESLDGPTTAGLLRPGTDRLVLFHVIASGRCWIELAGGQRQWANTGDVIVLPYGDQHCMGGVADAPRPSLATLLAPPPWQQLPVIVHGEGGDRTEVVCGYLYSDDPLFDPELRALPSLFVARPPTGPLAQWVRASVEYAMTTPMAAAASSDVTTTRLPELVLVEVLRQHLATAPASDHGWLAALGDPVVAPALARLHGAPGHKWTVGELAHEVAVSRSQLDTRFREVLGRSPIRYLTEWRMHVAADLLDAGDVGVATVARRVGYDSEEAFSRAFKRARGVPPSAWRDRGAVDGSAGLA